MGISTSPSRAAWWLAVAAVLLGAAMLAAGVELFASPIDPLLAVDALLAGIVGLVLGAVLAYAAFGPDFPSARQLAVGTGLAGTGLAVVLVFAGGDLLAAALIGLGSLTAVRQVASEPPE